MQLQKVLALTTGAAAAAGAGLLYYAARVEPERLVITRPRLKKAVPVKTVFFSDVHVGKRYAPAHLEVIVDAINAQQPELVLFGGDFFAKLPRDIRVLDFEWIADQLRRIQAPLGKFALLGNHDVRYGSQPYFYDLLARGGFSVLWNETVQLEGGISICGLSPYSSGRTLAQLPAEGYRICLCHMPDKARYLALGKCDLMLSGHSHDSQVHLPLLDRIILPPGGKMYPYGSYFPQGEDKAQLFVSRGIGTSGPPLRLGAAPEIVVLQPE